MASATNVKKMFSKSKRAFKHDLIVDFIPPQVHIGTSSYVWFSQFDPLSGRLKRKKYMLDRFPEGQARDVAARRIISNIYSQVGKGWNVWTDGDVLRQSIPTKDVLERYRQYIRALKQKGVMKQKTAYDYCSRLSVLCSYMEEHAPHIKMCSQLDQAFFNDFLDYLIMDRDLSATSRNNYRTWCSTFCSWLVEKRFIQENPIQYIRQLPEKEKLRDALPAEALTRMREYLNNHNRFFLLACMMEYYTFIRPDELRHIKVGNISIASREVLVPADVAKNNRERRVGLNSKVLHLMLDLNIFAAPSSYFLFSDDMRPGRDIIYLNAFRFHWGKLRKAMRWPESYQFYSLKDSGIRDLANAEGVVTARDQAGHQDIAITNKYLKRSKEIPESTKNFDGFL